MFDLDLSHINVNEFCREAQTFVKNEERYGRGNGFYIDCPRDSREWTEYWDLQEFYCKNGFSVGGVKITGEHYFYLNFCQIELKKETQFIENVNKQNKRKVDSIVTFPAFWDSDWYYFTESFLARENGQHMIVLKPRRRGYSYKNAAKCAYNYTFQRKSNSIILAEDKKYSEETMGMAVDYLDFLIKYTDFGHPRMHVDRRKVEIQSSYEEITPDGRKVTGGFFSRIMQFSAKNNPDVARGKAASVILFEEAGSFSNLLSTYKITRATVEQSVQVSGTIYVYGTGGDFSGGQVDFEKMFYSPEEFNFRAYNNIYEEGKESTSIGYFLPDYYSKGGFIKEETGESLVEEAKSAVETQVEFIKKNSKDPNALDSHLAEFPIIPAHAFIKTGTNIFPKAEINAQINEIQSNGALQNIGKRVIFYKGEDGRLKCDPSDDVKPIMNFPLKKDVDGEGCVLIYQEPYKVSGEIPSNLYYICCLTPGEKVITDRGLINVENVLDTDNLINEKGEYVNIIKKYVHNVENSNTYKIKISNTLRTTNFTSEHPILISKPMYNKTKKDWAFDFSYIKAENIEVGDWIKVPNVYRKEIEIEENLWKKTSWNKTKLLNNPLNNRDFWWLVGLWLGDGYCTNNTYNISFCFNSKETYYINKLRKICQEILNRKLTFVHKSGGGETHQISSEEVFNFLKNTFGSSAENKKLPEWVKFIKHDFKKELISGYLASDGCITKDKRNYYSMEFVSISLELLEGFQDIGLSLGYVSNLNKLRDKGEHIILGRKCQIKETYHLRFGHQETINLSKLLYSSGDCKLSKIDFNDIKQTNPKQKTFFFLSEDLNYFYNRVREIERNIYSGTVYNFETVTHTYLCHHITVHNCDPYAFDKTSGDSIGAAYVLKNINPFSTPDDIIVAEYIARPMEGQDEFNKNLFHLAEYYNAKIAAENDRGNILEYSKTNGLRRWLENEFDVYDNNDNIARRLNRGYGMSMNNRETKLQGMMYLRQWLLKPRGEALDGEKHLNVHKIYSIPLLKELLAFDPDKGNYDRVSSLFIGMYYRKQLAMTPIRELQKSIYEDELFINLKNKIGISQTLD